MAALGSSKEKNRLSHVPQVDQDTSLDVLDHRLGLNLVPWFAGAGRDAPHAIMLNQFLIRRIDVGS